MSSWSYALTNKGRQLQAKAQAGAQLVYTRMAIGRGSLSGQSLEAMTALITPVKDLTISRIKRPAGATRATIGATLTNQDVTTGFHLREIGIFATDPDDGEILYMYANAGATADYIAPKGDGTIEKSLNFNVFVGSAANITANIDESLVYVTKQELDDALEGITIEDASTAKKGIVQLSNAINSNNETMAATSKAVKSAYDAATAAQTTANAANAAVVEAQSKADLAFQSGNERKQEVVDLLVAKGIAASTTDSWEVLITKLSHMFHRFKAPNLIKNGSFENNDNCWSPVGAPTVTFPSNTGKFGSKTLLQANATGRLDQNVKAEIGHVYYFSSWSWFTSAQSYSFTSGAVVNGTNTLWNVVTSPTILTWHFSSIRFAPTTNNIIIMAGVYGDARVVNTNADGLLLLDLTDIFGAGNEPTQEVMDLIVQANGGWWDSDLQRLTSDATVLANQMLAGATAYKDGTKIIGTYVEPVPFPIEGNAVASDILSGKKATVLYNGSTPGIITGNIQTRSISNSVYPYKGDAPVSYQSGYYPNNFTIMNSYRELLFTPMLPNQVENLNHSDSNMFVSAVIAYSDDYRVFSLGNKAIGFAMYQGTLVFSAINNCPDIQLSTAGGNVTLTYIGASSKVVRCRVFYAKKTDLSSV